MNILPSEEAPATPTTPATPATPATPTTPATPATRATATTPCSSNPCAEGACTVVGPKSFM